MINKLDALDQEHEETFFIGPTVNQIIQTELNNDQLRVTQLTYSPNYVL